jgi:ribonucleoside-diphosphate reductase alpha chain
MNYHLLGDTIRTAVRFLDNVLSVNHYPLPEMKAKSQSLRRIGLGTTALADCLAMLGLRYGSEEGNKFIDKLYRFISKAAYESSVMLAVEKGAFPLCQPDKHVESGFMKRMPAKIRSLVKEHGIRNCCILTQAPTGTVSILSGNCSSGIEPMFAPAYERRYWDGDERKTELVFHPLFSDFMSIGKDVSHFVGSHDLSVRDHMEVQRIVQKHVDNAVSKTINIAHDYPIEEVEKLWLEYLPSLKGTTFYRESTRGFVNPKTGEVELPPLSPIKIEEAQRRFNEIHSLDSEQVDDCPGGICSI